MTIFLNLTDELKRSIILFDGYCNFCSRSVDFIIKRDKKKQFLFAASQSEAGIRLIEEFQLGRVDSVVLIEEGKSYRYSSAVLRICSKLHFPWSSMKLNYLIPVFIRDAVYKWIVLRRYKWFGKRNECRMPEPENRDWFL